MSTRVVLAEDSVLLREGISRLLRVSNGIDLVATCGDLPTLIAHVNDHRPDVVITDIRMPPTQTDEGLQAARYIRESLPDTGVVVLSQYVEPAYAMSLLGDGSGGRAYLLKERVADVGELIRAIEQVASGGSVIDPKVVDVLIDVRAAQTKSVIERLSPREREVLAEMASGKSNAAIAQSLVLSERAVEKHSTNIFTKLDLSTEPDVNRRVSAVLLWLNQGSLPSA